MRTQFLSSSGIGEALSERTEQPRGDFVVFSVCVALSVLYRIFYVRLCVMGNIHKNTLRSSASKAQTLGRHIE